MMKILLLIVLMPIMSMAWDMDSKTLTFEKLDVSFLEKACANTNKTVYVFDPEKSRSETYDEMSRLFNTKFSTSLTYHGVEFAGEFFQVQLILSNLVEKLEKVNADLVDFSRCPQFRIVFRCGPPLFYIVFGDKTIVQIEPGGRMANTTTEISKMLPDTGFCTTIQVDTVRQTFSMTWFDGVPLPNIITMSPILSYGTFPTEPICKKEWRVTIKALVAHMQLNVPVGENEK